MLFATQRATSTDKNRHYKSPPRRCCIEAKTKIYGKQMQYRSSQMLFWAVRRCCSKMAQMQYSGVLKHRCKNMLYYGCAPTHSSPYARARRCFVDAAQMQTVAVCFIVVAHPFLLLFSICVHLHSIYARLPPQMLFCTGGTRAQGRLHHATDAQLPVPQMHNQKPTDAQVLVP